MQAPSSTLECPAITEAETSAPPPAIAGNARSLRANLYWVMAGNAIHLASQWILVLLIARLGTPVMVGQLALAFAWTAPVFLFSHLRLRAVQATDANGDYQAGDYLMLRIITTAVALGLTLAFGLVYAWPDSGAFVVIASVAVAKSFESGSDIFYGLFQRWEEMRRTAFSLIVRSIVSIASVGVVMYTLRDVAAASIALALSSAVLFFFYDLRTASALAKEREIEGFVPRWKAATARRLAFSSLPLGISAMLMSFGVSTPRYFIEHYSGTREVGIFSAISYVALASGYVVSALGEAMSPRLSRSFSMGHSPEVNRLLFQSLFVAGGLGALAIVFFATAGPYLLQTIYGKEYAEAQALLMWLACAGLIANLASVVNYGMIAVRRFDAQLNSLIAMLVATVVFCALLIPAYESVGAAIALTIAYGAQAAYGAVWLWKEQER